MVVILSGAESVDRCSRVVAAIDGDVAVGVHPLVDTVKSVAAGRVRSAGDRAALREIVGPWAFTRSAFDRAAATGVPDPLSSALAAGLDVQTIELPR